MLAVMPTAKAVQCGTLAPNKQLLALVVKPLARDVSGSRQQQDARLNLRPAWRQAEAML